jgi:hypothetical protein
MRFVREHTFPSFEVVSNVAHRLAFVQGKWWGWRSAGRVHRSSAG